MSNWFRAFLLGGFLLCSMPHDLGRWIWWVDLMGGVCWVLIGSKELWARITEGRRPARSALE